MTRSEEIYDFIKTHITSCGYAPSRREIDRACGITTTSLVSSYLSQLRREGKIKVIPNVARGIVLVEEAK